MCVAQSFVARRSLPESPSPHAKEPMVGENSRTFALTLVGESYVKPQDNDWNPGRPNRYQRAYRDLSRMRSCCRALQHAFDEPLSRSGVRGVAYMRYRHDMCTL